MRKYLEIGEAKRKEGERWNERLQRESDRERERSEGRTETERWFKIAGGWKLIFRAH